MKVKKIIERLEQIDQEFQQLTRFANLIDEDTGIGQRLLEKVGELTAELWDEKEMLENLEVIAKCESQKEC